MWQSTAMDTEEVTPETILRVASGFMAAKHLFVANEIGLFDALANGRLTLDQLAERVGIPRRTVRIASDAMITLGLLTASDGYYENSAVATRFLPSKNPGSLAPVLSFWNRISYPAWMGLEASVRSGEAQPRLDRFSEEDEKVFLAGVAALTAGPANALAEAYPFDKQRVLDLGGGTGSFLVSIIQRHPDVTGTLFEIPPAAKVASGLLESQGMSDRIEVVGGDFFADEIPSGRDAVLIANVIHLFTADRNIELLGRTRQAVAPGASLLLVDFWTDESHTKPELAAMMAGEFLVIAGTGDVYSEPEVASWLSQTGWRFLERRQLAGPSSLITAEAV